MKSEIVNKIEKNFKIVNEIDKSLIKWVKKM